MRRLGQRQGRRRRGRRRGEERGKVHELRTLRGRCRPVRGSWRRRDWVRTRTWRCMAALSCCSWPDSTRDESGVWSLESGLSQSSARAKTWRGVMWYDVVWHRSGVACAGWGRVATPRRGRTPRGTGCAMTRGLQRSAEKRDECTPCGLSPGSVTRNPMHAAFSMFGNTDFPQPLSINSILTPLTHTLIMYRIKSKETLPRFIENLFRLLPPPKFASASPRVVIPTTHPALERSPEKIWYHHSSCVSMSPSKAMRACECEGVL